MHVTRASVQVQQVLRALSLLDKKRVLDASLEMWKALVGCCGPQDYDGSLKELLEAHLGQRMSAGGNKDASLLYSLLLQLSPSETRRLCLQSKWLSTQQKSQIIASPQLLTLLSSIITTNPIVFGTIFLVHLVGMKEDYGSAICMLEKGAFDEEIAILSKYTKLLIADCFCESSANDNSRVSLDCTVCENRGG